VVKGFSSVVGFAVSKDIKNVEAHLYFEYLCFYGLYDFLQECWSIWFFYYKISAKVRWSTHFGLNLNSFLIFSA